MSAGASIARNSTFALATQLTTATFTAVLTLYLVRALDPAGYGIFALALAFGGLLTLPSDFGVSAAAARFIAERRGDRDAVASIFADALRLKLLLAGGASATLLLAAGPIASLYGDDVLAWPLRGIALALFGQSLLLLFSGSFTAQGRVDRNLVLVSSESVLELTASVVLVALGAGAAGAAFGRATGYGLGAAVGLLLTVRLLGRGAVAIRGRARARGLSRYARSLAVVDWAYGIFDQLDVLLIGAFLGPAAVGLFQAPLRFVAFLFYPGYALASGVAPRLARRGDAPPNVAAFSAALRLSILVQGAFTAFVLGWAEPLVDLLLGPKYRESADVLRALAPYVFFAGFGVLVSLGANYLGQARQRVPLALSAVAINLVIDIALIPRIGIVAGAIGTDVGYGFYVLGHLRLCTRSLALPLRPIAVTFFRTALAAGTAVALLLALGRTDVGLLTLAAGGAAAVVAYLAVLFLTGEVSGEELQSALRAGRRRLRRNEEARP